MSVRFFGRCSLHDISTQAEIGLISKHHREQGCSTNHHFESLTAHSPHLAHGDIILIVAWRVWSVDSRLPPFYSEFCLRKPTDTSSSFLMSEPCRCHPLLVSLPLCVLLCHFRRRLYDFVCSVWSVLHAYPPGSPSCRTSTPLVNSLQPLTRGRFSLGVGTSLQHKSSLKSYAVPPGGPILIVAGLRRHF